MTHGPLKTILYPITQFVTNPAYREFVRLLAAYGRKERYVRHTMRCLNHVLQVPDAPSAVFQFKDIFVDEHYRFTSASDAPRILDCGANIGMSCLYFKSLYPRGVVTAFEADGAIAAVLQSNLSRNGINDVTVVPKAVWTTNDGIEFSSDGADGGSVFGTAAKKMVPSVRLADILGSEPRVDLLKMDIEGAEVEVIEDCVPVLDHADRIYIEYHAWKNSPQHLDRMLSGLTKAGFRYYLQSVSEIHSPLFRDRTVAETDLQLHVFATHSRLHTV